MTNERRASDPSEPMPMRPLPPGAEEAHLAWKAIFAKRVVILLLTVAVFGTLALNTVVVVLIRTGQVDRAGTFELLVDCTNGHGKCSRRGQQQTAKAVAAIRADNRHTAALAASCASVRYGQTTAEIAKCIETRLAAEERKHR